MHAIMKMLFVKIVQACRSHAFLMSCSSIKVAFEMRIGFSYGMAEAKGLNYHKRDSSIIRMIHILLLWSFPLEWVTMVWDGTSCATKKHTNQRLALNFIVHVIDNSELNGLNLYIHECSAVFSSFYTRLHILIVKMMNKKSRSLNTHTCTQKMSFQWMLFTSNQNCLELLKSVCLWQFIGKNVFIVLARLFCHADKRFCWWFQEGRPKIAQNNDCFHRIWINICELIA